MKNFVYLASQSPRRRQLLEQIGVRYELLLPTPDEDAEALEIVLPGEAPLSYVKRVTQLKLEAAMLRLKTRNLPKGPVLCADTTVGLGPRNFGKARQRARCFAHLEKTLGQHPPCLDCSGHWRGQAPSFQCVYF